MGKICEIREIFCSRKFLRLRYLIVSFTFSYLLTIIKDTIKDTIKELHNDPMADIADSLVNSPMSVSSNKSDGSLSDIRRLTALSLSNKSPQSLFMSSNPQRAGPQQDILTPQSDRSLTGVTTPTVNASAAKSEVAVTLLEEEEENLDMTNSINNNLFGIEDDTSKASFIDAFLRGITTIDFGGGASATRRSSFVDGDALMKENEDLLDIDLLDENVLLNMIEEENREENREEDEYDLLKNSTGSDVSDKQRSLSSPVGGGVVDAGGGWNKHPSATGRDFCLPSPLLRRSTSLNIGDSTGKPLVSSEKPTSEKKKNNNKKRRLSRLKSDSALSSRDSAAAHPYLSVERVIGGDIPLDLRRRHTVSGDDGGGRLYFENKEYFKFRSHLRELVRKSQPRISGSRGGGEMRGSLTKMKSSRLFLGMLTKHCAWAEESVKSTTVTRAEVGVVGEEKINMENFTKRQITVLNDISPERVRCLSLCLIFNLFFNLFFIHVIHTKSLKIVSI